MQNDPSQDSGTVTLIVGATSDIGGALARLLVQEGGRVVLAGRNLERLETLAGELEATVLPVDAANFDSVEACLGKAIESAGRVTGVVNCAGSLFLKPAHLTGEDDWRGVIDANLGSAFATVRAAGKHLARSGGAVVLLASAAVRHGLPNHEAIGAAKAGIVGLTRNAAASYASRGLRFNAVAPGMVETKLTRPLLETEAARRISTGMHPVGRIGQPEDVARAMAWLLRPENDWITGQIIGVDGGIASLAPKRQA